MKLGKHSLFPQKDPRILCTQVPQLIHDLVIHSVLLILGRFAPFPWGAPLFSISPIQALVSTDFISLSQTTCTRFTTLFLSYPDP